MTRKQERRARVLRWAAIVLAASAAAALVLVRPGGLAGAVLASAVMLVALAAGHREMIAPPGVAILTYHSVSPSPGWLPWSRKIAVHPDTFARHLAVLRWMGAQVIGTRTLVAARAQRAPVPPRAVVLHFDDGYLDNHRYAAPLLRAHRFPATFFPSLDFIEPGRSVRRDGPDDGYMSWPELGELAATPGFEVEPHGVDHARVPTSPDSVGTLDAANWRRNAWMQWAGTPGPKYDWFRMTVPTAMPLGSAIPQSGLALAERAWRDGERESPEALASRIERDLTACRLAFVEHLGQAPLIFCWPENRSCAEGRTIARRLGYVATTGGRGRNTAAEPADVLSRVHVGDRVLGIRWLPAEALHFYATVRLMQGNHYWYLVVAPMNLVRRLVFAVRARMGQDFA